MHIPQDAVLLRIFIGESDVTGIGPLYEAIVLRARELQLAVATVLRGRVVLTKLEKYLYSVPIPLGVWRPMSPTRMEIAEMAMSTAFKIPRRLQDNVGLANILTRLSYYGRGCAEFPFEG